MALYVVSLSIHRRVQKGPFPATRYEHSNRILSVWSCSQTCQAAAWNAGHKRTCKRMAQEAMQELITRTGGCLLMTNLVTQAVPGLSAQTPIEQATALSWTLRDEAVWVQWHIRLLTSRALIELAAHHDLQARCRLASMITRALTTLDWPRLASSAQEWLDYFHLALSLIQLGGREEAIHIMAQQLEGIENRAPAGIAALSLLRLSKALVDKTYAEAEKMGRFVKAANVFPQQTIAALDRAAALLPALDGDVVRLCMHKASCIRHTCTSPLDLTDGSLLFPRPFVALSSCFTGLSGTVQADVGAAQLSSQGHCCALCQTPPRALAAGH